MTELTAWQNFYVIMGSSAGALIGLQFVVLSLVASRPGARPDADSGHAFATPTIVHFGAVLAMSALLTAPWRAIGAPAFLWGLSGLAGAVYTAIVMRRMRAQGTYRPEFEDWFFHVLLPLTAYLDLAVSACFVQHGLHDALIAVGGAALLLLFSGIHNAWDAVTYHVFVRTPDREG